MWECGVVVEMTVEDKLSRGFPTPLILLSAGQTTKSPDLSTQTRLSQLGGFDPQRDWSLKRRKA